MKTHKLAEDLTYNLQKNSDNGLEYVFFYKLGLEKIADHYRDYSKYKNHRFPIDIFMTEKAGPALYMLELIPKFIATFKQLDEENWFAGIILNNSMHAVPYLLFKNSEGKNFVIDFKDSYILDDIKNKNFTFISVKGYKKLQRDFQSCSIIAIDVLKNLFIDEEWLEKLRHYKIGDELHLNKKTIAQNSEDILALDEEHKKKYVENFTNIFNGRSRDLNMKSFYKGHFYAQIINPRHFELVSEETKKYFEKIDQLRRDYKAKKISAAFAMDDLEEAVENSSDNFAESSTSTVHEPRIDKLAKETFVQH